MIVRSMHLHGETENEVMTREKKTKKNGPTRYGPKAQEKVGKVMREFKQGKLNSGSGQKVKSRTQAISIGLSEARREGDKTPPPRKASTSTTSRTRSRTTSRSTRSSGRG